jgi:hypothetical protein
MARVSACTTWLCWEHCADRDCYGTALSLEKPGCTPLALKADDLSFPGQVVNLSKEDIFLLNPNSQTRPIFRSEPDAAITKEIYRRIPVLLNESSVNRVNPWGVQTLRRFDRANDAELFVSEDFFDEQWESSGIVFSREGEEYSPLMPRKKIITATIRVVW